MSSYDNKIVKYKNKIIQLKIFDKLSKIVSDNNYTIITIAEVSHNSISSHIFQAKLMEKLFNENLINTITTEFLSNCDVFLINLWLKNKLPSIDLLELCQTLPLGGLGTYHLLKTITENNLKIKFIPSEADIFFFSDGRLNNPKLLQLLQNMTSKIFGEKLTTSDIYYSLQSLEKIKKFINSKNDRKIYDIIKDGILYGNYDAEQHSKRYDYWVKNLSKNIYSETKLYIVGYHIFKEKNNIVSTPGVITNGLSKYGKILHLGMASSYMETIGIRIKSQAPLMINDINFYDTSNNNIIDESINGLEILNISDFVGLTKLEEKFRQKYSLINCEKYPNNHFKIKGVGISIFSSNNDNNNLLEHYLIETESFDYIIFIPKSEYDKRLWY